MARICCGYTRQRSRSCQAPDLGSENVKSEGMILRKRSLERKVFLVGYGGWTLSIGSPLFSYFFRHKERLAGQGTEILPTTHITGNLEVGSFSFDGNGPWILTRARHARNGVEGPLHLRAVCYISGSVLVSATVRRLVFGPKNEQILLGHS